jgi:hypothetical protein
VPDEIKRGKGRCAVGSGGPWQIESTHTETGCDMPHHLIWLPKGYGPCQGQFVVALVGRPFDNYELDKQLADAVAAAIENFIWAASRRHRPVTELGWQPEPTKEDDKHR